jgi:hypothetical protein
MSAQILKGQGWRGAHRASMIDSAWLEIPFWVAPKTLEAREKHRCSRTRPVMVHIR